MLSRKPDWAGGSIGVDDAAFLAGLLAESRPQRLLEIGVASGMSSAIMVEVLKSLEVSFQISGIDTAEKFYLDASYDTDQLVKDLCGEEASSF